MAIYEVFSMTEKQWNDLAPQDEATYWWRWARMNRMASLGLCHGVREDDLARQVHIDTAKHAENRASELFSQSFA